MDLDPQAQAILQAMAALPPMDFATLDVASYRAATTGPSMFAPGDAVASVEDCDIPGPGGPLRLRIYRPNANGPLPLTLFFHGGGFVACGLDTHDNLCRCLTRRAQCIVVSVDYRLAPEAKFPAAVGDACAALAWVHAQASPLGVDASRIAVAGDSAGGNLAAVLAQQMRGTELAPCHQLLFYPVTDCRADSASYREYAEGYYLSAEMMQWFLRHYLPTADSAEDARASPLRAADLTRLPAATIFTAGCDPLRDEGEAYAQALAATGVAATLRRWPGQIHGFISMLGAIDDADRALTAAAATLKAAFIPASARQRGRLDGTVELDPYGRDTHARSGVKSYKISNA